MKTTKLPILFISHGAPNIITQQDPVLVEWLNQRNYISTPKAILIMSAHWECSQFTIGGNAKQHTIHDFSGFEDELHQMQYHVKSSVDYANFIASKNNLTVNHQRGLDHGSWVPLSVLYPDADIPVMQLSLSSNATIEEHYLLGKKLAYLRDKNILIIGSGVIVHNLNLLNWHNKNANTQPWAEEFMSDFQCALDNRNIAHLCDPFQLKNSSKALPSIEHYLPFAFALGAAENDKAHVFSDSWQYGNLSMHSYTFK